MGKPIIEAKNISKVYRLGEIGATSLREEAERTWRRLRGKEPPSEEGDFWALKGITFEIQQGEVVGIIGKNGAGKSTMLKILSRITEPSEGEIRLRGRVAALLEVGTGFHPELTGRENIYLNGTILGMKKKEIDRKLEEIIDFSGIDKHIDTPVKRYSSGMNVRLGFAVAAHLEPEILIVDEVLAVGDFEFQKKCLGKMQDVAGQGRTVLFVSHNMASVSRLTNRCIQLKKGTIEMDGPTPEVVERYVTAGEKISGNGDVSNAARLPWGNNTATLLYLAFEGENASFKMGEGIKIRAVLRANEALKGVRFHLTIFASDATPVGTTTSSSELELEKGEERSVIVDLHQPSFAPGQYFCNAVLVSGHFLASHRILDCVPDVLYFEVVPQKVNSKTTISWQNGWGKTLLPELQLKNANE